MEGSCVTPGVLMLVTSTPVDTTSSRNVEHNHIAQL